ncbi:hypothetical protein [Aeromonas jandaei]|uniref:hypothetical protein n=1 Tax=Aeromonas jandaei TaxID=650 RepID=UPI003B9E58F0
MRKSTKLSLFIVLLFPLLFLLVPFVNSYGCDYRSQLDTPNITIAGVCKNGVLRTLTHFKDSGLTISNTMLVAYREPYLMTVSISKNIVTPPITSSTQDALNILSAEYLTPVVRRFHIKKIGNDYVFLLRPATVDKPNANLMYKMKLDGVFSYWD